MPWIPEYTPTFRRDYKNLSSQSQQRVNEAIREILNSEEPERLGRLKYGKWKGAYGYDIGRNMRVLYLVEPQSKLAIFLRCGLHTIYRR